jgi:hypothetical protein
MKYLSPRDLSTLRLASRAFLLLLLLTAVEREASGYTDPGSGALLWQVLVAGFVGGMYYFRNILQRIRGKKRQ